MVDKRRCVKKSKVDRWYVDYWSFTSYCKLSIIKLLAEYIFVLFLFFYSCNSCQLFAANRCFEYIPLSTRCSNNCSIIIHTMNTGN